MGQGQRAAAAGKEKRILLQLDNAGWHGAENLVAPDGIRLVFQPANSPELQPVEHLWAFVASTLFHWWPRAGTKKAQ